MALSAFAVAFSVLAILARSITGAPNVQVAFPGQVHDESIVAVASVGITAKGLPLIDRSEVDDSFIASQESGKTNYRKYLCPDRALINPIMRYFDEPHEVNIAPPRTFPRIDTPSSIQAHAPPMTEEISHYISHSTSKGASHFELPDEDQCGGRVGINGLRT